MLGKVKSILGSVRFWTLTLAAASLFVGYVEVNGFLWSDLLKAVSGWLGVVAGVGTLDSMATKFGSSIK